jgi:hypothetical protein
MVTITRRQLRNLVDTTVQRGIDAGFVTSQSPEVVKLQEFVETATIVARGTNSVVSYDGTVVCCPMIGIGFDLDKSDAACRLACIWDDVTYQENLALDRNTIICINPLT